MDRIPRAEIGPPRKSTSPPIAANRVQTGLRRGFARATEERRTAERASIGLSCLMATPRPRPTTSSAALPSTSPALRVPIRPGPGPHANAARLQSSTRGIPPPPRPPQKRSHPSTEPATASDAAQIDALSTALPSTSPALRVPIRARPGPATGHAAARTHGPLRPTAPPHRPTAVRPATPSSVNLPSTSPALCVPSDVVPHPRCHPPHDSRHHPHQARPAQAPQNPATQARTAAHRPRRSPNPRPTAPPHRPTAVRPATPSSVNLPTSPALCVSSDLPLHPHHP